MASRVPQTNSPVKSVLRRKSHVISLNPIKNCKIPSTAALMSFVDSLPNPSWAARYRVSSRAKGRRTDPARRGESRAMRIKNLIKTHNDDWLRKRVNHVMRLSSKNPSEELIVSSCYPPPNAESSFCLFINRLIIPQTQCQHSTPTAAYCLPKRFTFRTIKTSDESSPVNLRTEQTEQSQVWWGEEFFFLCRI